MCNFAAKGHDLESQKLNNSVYISEHAVYCVDRLFFYSDCVRYAYTAL